MENTPVHVPEPPIAARPQTVPRRAPAVRIRPLTPSDRARYVDFLGALEPEDLYLRKLGAAAPPGPDRITELLAVDGRRSIALAAVEPGGAIVGVVRAAVDAADASAEFALIVRSKLKRRGLGMALLRALLERVSELGIRRVVGHTFAHNEALLRLTRSAGFRVRPGDDGATRKVTLALQLG
jgi:acetyltransferase